MRILILGASGMLGHKLAQRLALAHHVSATLRDDLAAAELAPILPGVRLVAPVDAGRLETIRDAIRDTGAEAVINCIGIIKQLKASKDPRTAITVNALFPHEVAALCAEAGARMIHFSTDCVFSGDTPGPHRFEDLPDARDLYGRTKLLGEVDLPHSVTLRSSIIGHELRGHLSLVDWFLSQRGGEVKGFANALYTGLPTVVMADLVARVLTEWQTLSGTWQVASDPIDKYRLLQLIDRQYSCATSITRDEAFRCDRRLDGTAFQARTGWQAPPWPEMVEAMHADFLLHRKQTLTQTTKAPQ